MSTGNVQYIINADLQSLDCTKLLNKGGICDIFPEKLQQVFEYFLIQQLHSLIQLCNTPLVSFYQLYQKPISSFI